jgi:hypothetical protein
MLNLRLSRNFIEKEFLIFSAENEADAKILNRSTISRVSAMKMKATIEIEFEATEGQDENVLRPALFRGRSGLAESIEHGSGRASTGIKPGSVKIEITKSEVLE